MDTLFCIWNGLNNRSKLGIAPDFQHGSILEDYRDPQIDIPSLHPIALSPKHLALCGRRDFPDPLRTRLRPEMPGRHVIQSFNSADRHESDFGIEVVSDVRIDRAKVPHPVSLCCSQSKCVI